MAAVAPRSSFRLLSRQLQSRNVLRLNNSRGLASSAPRSQQQPERKDSQGRVVDFGFENIAESLKQSRVAGVFSSVASSYDTMNDAMSLGIHRLWKDHFVRGLNPGLQASPSIEPSLSGTTLETTSQGWNILDIAGGTGDIAFRMLDHASVINKDNHTRVLVADINGDMLAEGRKRALETQYAHSDRLAFAEANAEDLTALVPSNSCDLYTVAFGIRNFTDKPAALREAFRVLKPGGVFACLEFSHVDNALFNAVYKRWSFSAIPLIGQVVAGDRDSYQYLVESIEKFPTQRQFRNMIEEAGFDVFGQGYENLTGGVAAIHKGVKPLAEHTLRGP